MGSLAVVLTAVERGVATFDVRGVEGLVEVGKAALVADERLEQLVAELVIERHGALFDPSPGTRL